MILIISNQMDAHATKVEELLELAGIQSTLIGMSHFPQTITGTMDFPGRGDTPSRSWLGFEGRQLDMDSVTVVWNRRPSSPKVSDRMSQADQGFAQAESAHFLNGLWRQLGDRFWINPLHAARAAEAKPFQLAVAREVGFRVPETVITSDPDVANAFLNRVNGPAIYKPLTFFDRSDYEAGPTRAVYTTLIQPQEVERRASQIRLAPCIFQEYIPKRVEIRATVIGDDIFAAEIHSQQSARSRVDWRRYDFENTPYFPHTLPGEVGATILRLTRRLGLIFGCVDLILTPEGEYIFLEINQAGQWYWVEILTGLPITDCFVRLLTKPSTRSFDRNVPAQP